MLSFSLQLLAEYVSQKTNKYEEDQGEPFILKEGDCVTQQPEIRHRVLEASDNLEVIEIGVPAEHMTTIDYDMELPTKEIKPDRLFQGQTFCRHQVENAEHEVEAASAQEEEIKANIAYLKLTSPIGGVVTARPVEPGTVVGAGAKVLTLIDLDNVYLRAFLPEAQIGRVKVGDQAKVYLDSFPDKPFKGEVIEIDPIASFTPQNIYFKEDRMKQVFGIKISIKNPDRFAKPGMPADAYLLIGNPGNR